MSLITFFSRLFSRPSRASATVVVAGKNDNGNGAVSTALPPARSRIGIALFEVSPNEFQFQYAFLEIHGKTFTGEGELFEYRQTTFKHCINNGEYLKEREVEEICLLIEDKLYTRKMRRGKRPTLIIRR